MTSKKTYFEFMRIIACALVIFNHLRGYSLYGISSGLKQFLYMTLTMITRINVPLFFMISGALLLEKQEDIKIVFKKRVSRIVIIMLLFEFFLYITTSLETLTANATNTSLFWDFIRKFVFEEKIVLKLCGTNDQDADFFTKTLSQAKQQFFTEKIGMHEFE